MNKLLDLIIPYRADIRRLKAELKEINRQQARIEPAYNLYKDVLFNYGFEWAAKLPHPDDIISDTKPITLINYLDI